MKIFGVALLFAAISNAQGVLETEEVAEPEVAEQDAGLKIEEEAQEHIEEKPAEKEKDDG